MLRRAQQRAQNILQTRSFILVGGILVWFWAFGVPFLGLDLIRMDGSNEYRRALQASNEDASSEHIETAMHKRLARLTEEMHRSMRNDRINEEDDTKDDGDSEPAEAAAAAASIAAEVASKQKQQVDLSSPTGPNLKGLRGLQSPLAGQRVLQGVPSTADSSSDADEESEEVRSGKNAGGQLSGSTGETKATTEDEEDSGKESSDEDTEAVKETDSSSKSALGKSSRGNDEEESEDEDSRITSKAAISKNGPEEDDDSAEQESAAQVDRLKAVSLDTEPGSETRGGESRRNTVQKAVSGLKKSPSLADGEDSDDSPAEDTPQASTAPHKVTHISHYEERDGKASGHPTVDSSENQHHEEEHQDRETQKGEELEGETRNSAKGADIEAAASDGKALHKESSQKALLRSGMVSAHIELGEGAETAGTKLAASSADSEPFIDDSSTEELAAQHAKFSKWAQSTHYPKKRSLPFFPLGQNSTADSLPRVMMVTARTPSPCTREGGDYVLYRTLKNKMDYARMHGMELFDVDAVVRPELDQWWQKVAIMPMLMLRHPDTEWFFWVDSDAVITDLAFEVPWEKYSSYHLVAYGYKSQVYREKDWNGLNGGIWLLRNSPESLSLLKEWATYGAKGETRDSWGKRFTEELKGRPTHFPADDQSALVWMMSEKPKKYRHLVYLEHEYLLHGDWESIIPGIDGLWHDGRPGSHVVEPAAKKPSSWPFITHFVGCKPCGGGVMVQARRQQCQRGMEKGLNFADNQVMMHYGLVHPSLTDPTLVPQTPASSSAHQSLHTKPSSLNPANTGATGETGETGELAEAEEAGDGDAAGAQVGTRPLKKLTSKKGKGKGEEVVGAEGEGSNEADESNAKRVVKPRLRRVTTKRRSRQQLAQAEEELETDESRIEAKSKTRRKPKTFSRVQKAGVSEESEAQER